MSQVLFSISRPYHPLTLRLLPVQAPKMSRCENKQRPTKWQQAKAVYSELARAGGRHQHLCFGRDSKADRWDSLTVEKEKASGVPWLETVVLENTLIEVEHPMWLVLSFLWLVLTWKQGQRLGKLPVIHQVQCLGAIVIGVIVWLPGPVARAGGLTSPKSACGWQAGFLGWFCRLWVRVPLLYMVWPLSVSTFAYRIYHLLELHWGLSSLRSPNSARLETAHSHDLQLFSPPLVLLGSGKEGRRRKRKERPALIEHI